MSLFLSPLAYRLRGVSILRRFLSLPRCPSHQEKSL